MNKTTVRNSEGQGGPRITHQSAHVYGDSRFFHERVTFIFNECKGIAVGFFFKILSRENFVLVFVMNQLESK